MGDAVLPHSIGRCIGRSALGVADTGSLARVISVTESIRESGDYCGVIGLARGRHP